MSDQSNHIAAKLYERVRAYGVSDSDILLAFERDEHCNDENDIQTFAQQLVEAGERTKLMDELTTEFILGRIRYAYEVYDNRQDLFDEANPYEDFTAIVVEAVANCDNKTLRELIKALRQLTPPEPYTRRLKELDAFTSILGAVRNGISNSRRQQSEHTDNAFCQTGVKIRLDNLGKTELNSRGKMLLMRMGYQYLCEILVMPEGQLRAIHGIGELTIAQIDELRQKHNVQLPVE